MKNRIILVSFLFFFGLVSSCYKEDPVNTNLSNFDTFQPGEVDDWITTNLTDPYNIEVIYRYQRNMHGGNRNIAPPDEAKVIPQMSVVLEGFLKLYEKVAGSTFIRTYTPKQFALFGSGNYEEDGSVIAGTADNGRRITLYGLNGLNTSSASSVLGNLGVIHHEFVHIINQIRMIPADYELVSLGDYYANWTNGTENSVAISRQLGFITPYARKNIGEDFAEVLSTLICSGQLYYNNYAFDSGTLANSKMKQKESIVRDYMQQNFAIDVTLLQDEFHRIMKNNYNSTAFDFSTALANNYADQIAINHSSNWATKYGVSESFNTEVYQESARRFAASGQALNQINLKYQSTSKLTVNVLFGNFTGAYDFDIVKTGTNTFEFKLSATQGTGTVYDNGGIGWVRNGAAPFLDYLSSHKFESDWYPQKSAEPALTYLKYAGFKVADEPTNYFYGEFTPKYN